MLSEAWPTLFPFDVGDVTNRNRQHSVTLKPSLEHYIKYCIRNSDGSWYYPFVEDKSFIMYLQDMHERYSIITQANVYMNNNIGDTNISLAWAWTPWKSQGSTFCDPIIIYPGNKEVDHCVSYVTFSRATKIDNIYIPDGIEMDRLCLKIKSSKKMTSRIEEEKRLQKLHDVTISKKRICINCFLCVCACVCNGIQETNTDAMTQCQFCI